MQLQVKVKEGFGVGQRKAKLSRSMQMFDKKHAKEDKIMQYTSYVREKILEKYPESTVKVQKKYIVTPLTPLKLFQITLNLFLEFKLFTQKNQEDNIVCRHIQHKQSSGNIPGICCLL